MKKILWLVLFGGGAVGLVAASKPDVAPDPVSLELQQLNPEALKLPDNYATLSWRMRCEWFEQQAQGRREKGLAFYRAFPTDPRRWQVVEWMISYPPSFVQSYGPNAQQDQRDRHVDEAAAARWRQTLAELESAMNTAGDVPAEVRVARDTRVLRQALELAYDATAENRDARWKSALRDLAEYAAKYPASTEPAAIMRQMIPAFDQSHPIAESLAVWQTLAESPNETLATIARGKSRAIAAYSEPVELAFTALDGAEVDLKKLRGKVVLIEFWATWCQPCILEMPNVVRIYQAYHGQGFEVIGVSCDLAPDPAKPSSKASSGPAVLAFARRHNMTWPQHYEGRMHNAGGNSLAARYAITGIPASLLLDASGRVVATNLRNRELEDAVRGLLKMRPN